MADKRGEILRYESQGELHRDFHASTMDGIRYMLDNYGEDALKEVIDATAKGVYRQMHEKLVAGDKRELVEYWKYYYLNREHGDCTVEETADGAILTVRLCPALAHLEKRGIAGGKVTCMATKMLNAALCEGSPFEIVCEETGDKSCRQILRRK